MSANYLRRIAAAAPLLVSLMLPLWVRPARAQSPVAAAPPSSPQAFAATVDRHYNQLHSLSVHFIQKYAGMGMHRQESGVLLLKRPGNMARASGKISGKMRWTYTDPPGKLFILDGRDAYFYTPGQTEIPRVPASKLNDLRSPLALLLGHTALAKELDGLTYESAGAGAWTLKGVPHGLEKRVASVAITASTDGTIDSMRIEETDGAINMFQLTDEQPNAPLPPGAFTFTPPVGTHVINGLPPL